MQLHPQGIISPSVVEATHLSLSIQSLTHSTLASCAHMIYTVKACIPPCIIRKWHTRCLALPAATALGSGLIYLSRPGQPSPQSASAPSPSFIPMFRLFLRTRSAYLTPLLTPFLLSFTLLAFVYYRRQIVAIHPWFPLKTKTPLPSADSGFEAGEYFN